MEENHKKEIHLLPKEGRIIPPCAPEQMRNQNPDSPPLEGSLSAAGTNRIASTHQPS
ncbi:hypothetical protein PIB30_003908 [Stylosanthes scabra]|uniref:Uncharacterized protein n=1 Tax=Stylosanthes scabra TaxID=79078 RepID=A0ABU6U3E0_9FABA|nr:hypothetical protein [Stylosanthes scabra]